MTSARRKLIKALGGGSIAAIWTAPVVKSVILPVHAMTSGQLALRARLDAINTTGPPQPPPPPSDGLCTSGADLAVSATATPAPPDGTVVTLDFSQVAVPGFGGLVGTTMPGTLTASTAGGVANFGPIDLCVSTTSNPPETGDFTLTFRFQDPATFGTDVDTLLIRFVE